MSNNRLLRLPLVLLAVLIGCGSADYRASQPRLPDPDEFSVVLLPDVQCYTSLGGAQTPGACGLGASQQMFVAQANWIRDSKEAFRIAAVAGLGDIVNCGENAAEWDRATEAYKIIRDTGLPFAPAVGNHDYDTICYSSISTRPLARYNAWTDAIGIKGNAWYQVAPVGAGANFIVRFTVAEKPFALLVLEFYPTDATLAWANNLVSAQPDTRFIVVTHSYLTVAGTRILDDDKGGPAESGMTADNNGQEMWDKFVRKHANIVTIVSGHVGGGKGAGAVGRRSDRGDNGNLVPQMVSNYQFDEGGGNGYLRVLTISPNERHIHVSTYSPYLGLSRSGAENEFTVDFGQ